MLRNLFAKVFQKNLAFRQSFDGKNSDIFALKQLIVLQNVELPNAELQNAEFQNIELQNVELQNAELQTVESYRTSNLTKRRNTKRRILQNVEIQNVENDRLGWLICFEILTYCNPLSRLFLLLRYTV
jgi:uncharacterized protein YjbI with pentapeptide repeats